MTEQMLITIATELLRWRHIPARASSAGPVFGKLPECSERWEDPLAEPRHLNDLNNGRGMVQIIEAMHARGYGCYTYLHPDQKTHKVEFVNGRVGPQWGEAEWLPTAVIIAAFTALSREEQGNGD